MSNKYKRIFFFFSLLMVFSLAGVMAQKKEFTNQVTIESIIKDEKGNPVKGATISGNEGSVVAKTDAMGRFSIKVNFASNLLIESDGYESTVLKPGDYQDRENLLLKSTPYLFGEKDVVNIAFGKV